MPETQTEDAVDVGGAEVVAATEGADDVVLDLSVGCADAEADVLAPGVVELTAEFVAGVFAQDILELTAELVADAVEDTIADPRDGVAAHVDTLSPFENCDNPVASRAGGVPELGSIPT